MSDTDRAVKPLNHMKLISQDHTHGTTYKAFLMYSRTGGHKTASGTCSMFNVSEVSHQVDDATCRYLDMEIRVLWWGYCS